MLVNGQVPADYWAGKIVLIGPYTAALQDAYFTSIDKARQMYGVEYQANVIQSLLESNYKTEVPDTLQLLVLFAICLSAAFIYLKLKMLYGGFLCGGLIISGGLIPYLLYFAGLVTHPLWLPVCSAALYIFSIVKKYIDAARERHALALEKERINAELSLATRIQASALLHDFPAFPDRKEFDLYASMDPAKEVGGDLYDFFLIDDDHLSIVIGDVSGKGIPGALFMMVAVELIRFINIHELSPAKVLMAVNDELCARNSAEMFVTVWIGVLEISTGKLVTANAGHEYPAIKAPDGSFELAKDRHGLVVGGMEGVRYRETEYQLKPGEKIFVYTDGVPEATNAENELFGTDRMIRALREKENGTPEQILGSVTRAVNEFVGDAPQFDDLTMLCLEYFGIPEPEG